MLYDKASIDAEAGRGGDGAVSFRREAHVPKGGPDGGDGGRGGDVVLLCDGSKRDLSFLRRKRHFKAKAGAPGEGARKHGARGEDVVIQVPPGTEVMVEGGATFDLTEPGQRAVVAVGGAGGRGNRSFATPTNQAPRLAERGLAGEHTTVELRLKLLADAGLVGVPNAGKSSLLASLTRARPKVAAYPFTTVEPVLGTLDTDERQLVLADVPGLIEGAAQGAGLGHEFLAHVERCRLLVHVVDIGAEDPEAAYSAVRAELAGYGHGLERFPELVVLSKRDLRPEGEVEAAVAEWKARLGERAIDVLPVSSVSGAGVPELSRAILAAHDAIAPTVTTRAAEFEAEHRVYRPGRGRSFEVVRVEDGVFRIQGPGVEQLVERHDLASEEALAHVERRLAAIGVVRALREAGFDDGQEIQIGDAAFDFWPDG
jgi:GTP-binding protein